MSSGHNNRGNRPRLSRLEWFAFCYVADELKDRQRDAFELRLSVDQRAREAVATAVENFALIKATLESDRAERKLSEQLPSRVRSSMFSRASRKSGRAPIAKLARASANKGVARQVHPSRFQPAGSPKLGFLDPRSLRSHWRQLRLETVAVITTACLVMLMGNLIWNPRFQLNAPLAPNAALPVDAKVMSKILPVTPEQNEIAESDTPDLLIDQSIDQAMGRSNKELKADSNEELSPVPAESREVPINTVESVSLKNQSPSAEQRAVALFQFWTKEGDVHNPSTLQTTTEPCFNESMTALLSMTEEQIQYEESDPVILEDGNWLFEALWEKANQAKPLSQPQSDSPSPNENKPSEFWG